MCVRLLLQNESATVPANMLHQEESLLLQSIEFLISDKDLHKRSICKTDFFSSRMVVTFSAGLYLIGTYMLILLRKWWWCYCHCHRPPPILLLILCRFLYFFSIQHHRHSNSTQPLRISNVHREIICLCDSGGWWRPPWGWWWCWCWCDRNTFYNWISSPSNSCITVFFFVLALVVVLFV